MNTNTEVSEHDSHPAEQETLAPVTLADNDEEEKLFKSGDVVAFEDFATPADGDEECTVMAETIHAQMGLFSHRNAAIRSAWAVQGRHRAGGELLSLDSAKTVENGDIFTVSYHLRDDYTITYAKRDGDSERAIIIEEVDMVFADQLCEIFTKMTGIEIPIVPFG